MRDIIHWASLVAQRVKHLPAMQETWVRSLGQEDPLEKEMATHSSTPAWKIPWTEKPGRLQSMGSRRAGHNWVTSLGHLVLAQSKLNVGCYYSWCSPGGGNGNLLQCSCLGNPIDRGAWWATVHGVTKSRTRLSTHIDTHTYIPDAETQPLHQSWIESRRQSLRWSRKEELYCLAG